MQTFDFLVIGSGIAGASVAHHLALHAKVMLVEQEEVHGYHATGRSAALLTEAYGSPLIRHLTSVSRPFFDNPPDGFVDYPLLGSRGCLYLGTAASEAGLMGIADDLAARHVNFSRLGGEALRERLPLLKNDADWQAVLEHAASDIDVDGIHRGYLRSIRKYGAHVVTGQRVTGLERQDGVWMVDFHKGNAVSAATVVNAAGAWADQVAVLAGLEPLGLVPHRRTAIILDAPEGIDVREWPAVINVEEQYYFKPEAGKVLASPADETPALPGDAAPDELDIAVCVDRIQQVVDLPVQRVVRSWAGLRTFSPDRNPVVGMDPRVSGFFWLAGQGGYGVQTAPALSGLAAALALGHALPDAFESEKIETGLLRPERFF